MLVRRVSHHSDGSPTVDIRTNKALYSEEQRAFLIVVKTNARLFLKFLHNYTGIVSAKSERVG